MGEYNFVTCAYVHMIIYKTVLPGHLLTIRVCVCVCACARECTHTCVCVCPAVVLLALVIQILERQLLEHLPPEEV